MALHLQVPLDEMDPEALRQAEEIMGQLRDSGWKPPDERDADYVAPPLPTNT
eukprot:SAG22_NODE_259_length_13477_cov_10.020407_6_plen_52_part_00